MKSSDFVNETLKRVNGRWALVSKSNPKKVLQYYHGGDQRPSEEWVNSVERRVHSFGEGVTESLDRPYPVEWDKDDFGDLHALAFLDDGSPLEIKFVQESGGQWHIVFDRNYRLRVTGEGDQQRVFATVLAAVKEFVKKRKPQKIIFSATKDVEPGQKSNSRASLYSSLINRYAAALGYTAHIDDRGDQVVYELMRVQKPVTESSGKTDAGYTWSFEPGREVPMKSDVDANTFIRVRDAVGKTVAGIWADVAGDSIQIEYSQVFDERLRGRGVYTDLLRSLSKQYNVISDKDNNNAATSIYKRLGADYDHRQAIHTLRKQGVAEGVESAIQKIEKKIQVKRDALGLAREQRRMRGQHQQGQREIKLQAEIDRLSNELTQLKKQGVTEDEHASTPRPQVVDSMKSMVAVGGIKLNVAIDGAEVSIRPVVDGYQAGYVVFDRDGRTLVPDDLAIDDEFRGRGIAKIIYDYVKSLGFTIRRSSDQTKAGKHFWDKNRGEDSQVWEAVTDEDYDPNGPPPGPETKPTMPPGTVRVDVSDVYDWYKLGTNISNLDKVDKNIFGKGPPSTIMAFGSEDEEHKYISALQKLGLTTTDIDPADPKHPNIRQKVDPTFNVNEGKEQPDLMSAFKDFLPIAMRELDIKKLPPIRLLKQIPAGDQPTFGKFVNDENVVYLGIAERHPVDILRTLAHELVHYKQNTEHQLAAGSGATGSPEENQAHEVAGVIMRDFNRLHPEYFESQAVNLSEGADDSIIRNRNKLDAILVDLCSHVVEGQRVDPKKYGMVAACVVDLDDRQVIGVNELTQDGTRRHGERVAMDRYQEQYGDIPPGSIIVTTCSPCNEEHMTERYGESCADIINNSACQKVYCGFMDPSQDEEHNEFTLEVTSNSSIRELCEHFAATFLNENFADGRGPGRPGDSVRHGIPKNATMAELERASHAKGRKGQLARWQLNMRRGRNK